MTFGKILGNSGHRGCAKKGTDEIAVPFVKGLKYVQDRLELET